MDASHYMEFILNLLFVDYLSEKRIIDPDRRETGTILEILRVTKPQSMAHGAANTSDEQPSLASGPFQPINILHTRSHLELKERIPCHG